MSYLVVIKYGDAAEAAEVRKAIKQLSDQGLIRIEDAAMVSRGEDGKLNVHNELDKGVKWGAAIGGGLGLLIAGIMFPIGGIIIGALAGAAIGAATDHGIEKKFVKEVGDSLEVGQSALFVVIQDANATAVMSTLGQYKGEVYQTSLPSNVEAALRARVEGEDSGMSPAERATIEAATND
ncbi:MAG: DUF1269 domain-containing protein [Anaerolineae bacterium]|nr:DUF1269 domain-containing protein [Anaerolineae bacterium]MCB0232114.1 DUF1269 domain-containing protein [Anaerolineae bacterium]MCB0244358.1 DUF1269 domain-containing protein [Anaerolineae bacterium]MCB0248128.1 DUF1269 domain-containing protein [Anaerolineae bacterium]MCB9129345.1 DUF1269 domain-containing protein [Anaerolineales bacterium]